MAYLTQNELENAIWRATMMVLGYDPDSSDQSIQSRVRISWPLSDMGSPNWSRDEETVFIRITPTADDYTRLWDITYSATDSGLVENVSNHEHYEIEWVCYGVGALETANKLRFGLLRENIRAYLQGQNLAFKSVIDVPVRLMEQDRSGDWWNRFDVRARCYVLAQRQYSEGFIEHTPDITTYYAEYPEFVLDVDRLDVGMFGKTAQVEADGV